MSRCINNNRLGFRLDNRGTAAIEFGLAAPFLVLMLVGVIEIGTAIYEGMQAQNAAEAGAIYASKHGLDTNGISSAVTSATAAAAITATPAPSQFCGCPTAAGLAETQCSVTCAGGGAPGQYVRISARITHDPLLSFAGLVAPTTITGEAVLRMY